RNLDMHRLIASACAAAAAGSDPPPSVENSTRPLASRVMANPPSPFHGGIHESNALIVRSAGTTSERSGVVTARVPCTVSAVVTAPTATATSTAARAATLRSRRRMVHCRANALDRDVGHPAAYADDMSSDDKPG